MGTHVPVEAVDHSLKYTNMERLKYLSVIRDAVGSGGKWCMVKRKGTVLHTTIIIYVATVQL